LPITSVGRDKGVEFQQARDFVAALADARSVVREGLKRVLCANGWNWTLTEAEPGLQALEWLRRSEFDLAMVDLSLPGDESPRCVSLS